MERLFTESTVELELAKRTISFTYFAQLKLLIQKD